MGEDIDHGLGFRGEKHRDPVEAEASCLEGGNVDQDFAILGRRSDSPDVASKYDRVDMTSPCW
jgi:hypothetical protein